MNISKTHQEQRAGDNSSQYQQIGDNSNQTIIGNQTNNVSITTSALPDVVSFTTMVSTQVTAQALKLCTQVSHEICKDRMEKFESQWVPVITKMENAVNNLIDPKFQFMIRDANISAAKSSRQEDLEMLTQLLVCHIEKGSDMIKDAGINKAIQIVNEIDYDSLCGLTCVATILKTIPTAPCVSEGLKVMDGLFSKLLYTELPKGDNWIDHLDVLKAVGIKSGNFYKLNIILSSNYDGYACAGIKEGSEEHKKALEILEMNHYELNCLLPNECLPGYLRIGCSNKGELKPELKPIIDLYSKDDNLLKLAQSSFMEKWDSYEKLKKIREWFEEIPLFFRITSVGYALAQTNAKRCYPNFPDLI
ncbi:MAG: hypothetical protein J6T82_03025 [Bacteroidaceae bacterium]|nr:hypothetical protein [Bacteroidaceae bacterium]